MRVIVLVPDDMIVIQGESIKCELDALPGIRSIRFESRNEGFIEYLNGSGGAYKNDVLYDRLIEIWNATKAQQAPETGQSTFNL